ncbi:DUF2589 domain-containing protein [uncultured Brachyspira sp.]|uniref:DUF2589 domain-containing protein n=1 Tax=uncultured Brachyspira sp. TaxID=221953 RepID=UPI00261C0C5A|nr:DUF2589 domain-containing protein [uncultured Brachyspira sp.]
MAVGDNKVIANQFTGLPMSSLIGAPLQAAAEAQLRLANITKDFIESVGIDRDVKKDENGKEVKSESKLRTVEFAYKKIVKKDDGSNDTVDMVLRAPLLSMVKVPALFIKNVDITFDMEVKSSEEEKGSDDSSVTTTTSGKVGWWIFSARTEIKGSVSSHKENTRKTDTSAKYHVELHAVDQGMPEGLARVLDIINATIVPVESANTPQTKTENETENAS